MSNNLQGNPYIQFNVSLDQAMFRLGQAIMDFCDLAFLEACHKKATGRKANKTLMFIFVAISEMHGAVRQLQTLQVKRLMAENIPDVSRETPKPPVIVRPFNQGEN